jgi:cytochrome P450
MMTAHVQETEHYEEEKEKLSMVEDSLHTTESKERHTAKRALSRSEILSNALIFFLVGYETTASALSWVAHLLAIHPDVQERLHEEVTRVMEEHGGEATYEAIHKMIYLDQVVSETLRLYPSAQRSDRVASETVSVGGYTIPKGQIVNIGIMGMHRDPQYWPDPYKFNPDRFSPENKSSIVPYSFCPFGTGPRSCIGMRLAMAEIKTATAYLVTNFKLSRSHLTVDDPELKSMGFSAPVNGIHVKIDKR